MLLDRGFYSTSRPFNPDRESSSSLREGSYMSVEGTVLTAVPEWNGQTVRISYEDNAELTENGYVFFAPMQTGWYVIR